MATRKQKPTASVQPLGKIAKGAEKIVTLPTTPSTGWDKEKAEANALVSESLLGGLKSAEDVYKWYAQNYYASGHKRMGRLLVKQGQKLLKGAK